MSIAGSSLPSKAAKDGDIDAVHWPSLLTILNAPSKTHWNPLLSTSQALWPFRSMGIFSFLHKESSDHDNSGLYNKNYHL